MSKRSNNQHLIDAPAALRGWRIQILELSSQSGPAMQKAARQISE
jgi:hypothetical protein